MHRAGFGRASRVVVTPLGLATASPCSLVLAYGSGVRIPTHAKPLACSRRTIKPPAEAKGFIGAPGGIRTHDQGIKSPLLYR